MFYTFSRRSAKHNLCKKLRPSENAKFSLHFYTLQVFHRAFSLSGEFKKNFFLMKIILKTGHFSLLLQRLTQ